METSAISYRVADFLKQHPPFHAVGEADLVELAARGRVRFHEANDYVLWQGEPHRLYVYVIQQGTVSLWDEASGRSELRDVRGAGDLLGIEQFAGAPAIEYSARSESDVVIYAFPAADFESLVLTQPYAARYVGSYSAVTADFQGTDGARDPQQVFLHDVVSAKAPLRCRKHDRIRDVARAMTDAASEAVAIVDEHDQIVGVVTPGSLVAWIADGGGSADEPAVSVLRDGPPVLGANASVADGVLAMASADAEAIAMTDNGSSGGRLQAIVTPRDFARVFGDQPMSIVREIRRAPTYSRLRDLNQRARACALQQLTGAASVGWLARFLSLADEAIVQRVIALAGAEGVSGCWCLAGAAGRSESLTKHTPLLVLIAGDENSEAPAAYSRVVDAFEECGYLTRTEATFDRAFRAACIDEWRARYDRWVRDPILGQMYLGRPLFDLRPIHGHRPLWEDLEAVVVDAIDQEIVQVLANDCLASLPPLTFYEDAVVEESGEQSSTFRLDHSALQPLVDVGRVFGVAARKVFGTSTLERFSLARTLVPEHEWIFREASATLSILLAQQARVGISQNTTGSELPPALLSRLDRQQLKSGFRSIHQLLEFTADSPWFTKV